MKELRLTWEGVQVTTAHSGGREAALFTNELLDCYTNFAHRNGWRFELLEATFNDDGGLRECSANLTGSHVYGRLRYETGVHRVQVR